MATLEKIDTMTYHKMLVTEHRGPDVHQVVEAVLPEPLAGEVRVHVLAAGVSAYNLLHQLRFAFQESARSVYPGRR